MSKTQAMLISRRDHGIVVDHLLTVAGDVVVFSDSVKNLGLYIDNRLIWRNQVSRVVSRTYSTLGLLYRFQRYTSRDLRIYLVRSLIIPIFLLTLFLVAMANRPKSWGMQTIGCYIRADGHPEWLQTNSNDRQTK
jgi:hypothetical protein